MTEEERMKAILSGEGIARLLSDHLVIVDREKIVHDVLYADSTDVIMLRMGTDQTDYITFPRYAFEQAGYDENDGHTSYTVTDVDGITYGLAFYENRSEQVMRDVESYF